MPWINGIRRGGFGKQQDRLTAIKDWPYSSRHSNQPVGVVFFLEEDISVASIKTIERSIGNLEGFDVRFRHPDGSDVRGDKANIPRYDFERMARGSMTVAAWKDQRFRRSYAGFEVDVLDSNGEECHGGNLLSTVRETYTE
jgi:hypothetical protein